MSKGMPKFYDMETITQEKLNKLALERNTLEEENKYLSDKVVKYTEIVDQQASKLKSIEQTINDINKSDINENNLLTFLNEVERIVKEK